MPVAAGDRVARARTYAVRIDESALGRSMPFSRARDGAIMRPSG
jgi:hypothetical protein